MKLIKLLMLFCIGAFFLASNAIGQNANPGIAVAPSNAGVVSVGATNDLVITVNNSLAGSIATAKLRPIVTVPSSVAFLANASQTGLPAGWTILTNTGTQLRVCNTSDVLEGNGSRTIILKVQGVTITAPGTFTGQINFGNGTTCAAGTSVAGNNTADDFATSTIEVVAAAPCAIAVSATAGTIACNGGTTTLTATATGTTNPVEYSINGGTSYQSSNTFTVNAAGSPYTVIAREVANTTCNATATAVTVSQPTLVVAAGSISTPIATVGANGVITISATGGTAPYTGTGAFTRAAGTYSFTVTDANGCTGSTSVTISDPAACIITGVTATAGSILCNGGTTTLTATASPAGTYQYSLNGGAFQNGNTFTVSSGSYSIVARESANPVCTATTLAPVVVTNPSNVTATAVVTSPITAIVTTGTITVTGLGGTGAKTYVITSGPTTNTTGATTGVFSGLAAGNYTFTATDANGCPSPASSAITLASFNVPEADPAVGGIFFTTTSGGVQSANNLQLLPSAALYDVNIPFFNLNQANQVPNGTISFTINLGKKLVLAPGFTLASAPLNTFFSWTSANVGGNVIITGTQIAAIPADFDAIATFRVKGDSACSSNVVSNIVITSAGLLDDDQLNNNQSTLRYTLPITLTNTQVNVTCNGLANGIINLTVSSGTVVTTTGPAGYSNIQNVASGVNNFSLSSLAPGTYSITAAAPSDAPLIGCTITQTVIITQPAVLTLPTASISSTNNNCFGNSDGSITVVANGGTPPYTFTIAGPTVNITGALNGIFTGLTAGSYVVTVTDNNGCTATPATARVITQPIGGTPDLTLGADFSDNIFTTVGESETIVYNIAEVNGNSAVGDTLRITKVDGYTITFNPTLFTVTVGGIAYNLDNTRWKIDNTNPAFVSIILTDPLNSANPGTILCNQLVRVAVSITRNTSNFSIFPVSARIRRANGEVNLANNFNAIIFSGE